MDIVIIEDEDLAASSLEKLLLKSKHTITIKKRLESVKQSIDWFKTNSCDLILSDIHLGDGESFEIFETLHVKTPIIFTTAFDTYAIQSFQYFAVDYLLKPYDKLKLDAALEKYVEFIKGDKEPNGKLEELLKQMNSKSEVKTEKQRFLVTRGMQLMSIKSKDIAYFMAQDKYLFLYTKDGESYLYEDTVSDLEVKLSKKDFFKINRKYIVKHSSIKSITKYSKNRIKLELDPASNSEELILVSSKNIVAFKGWLNQ